MAADRRSTPAAALLLAVSTAAASAAAVPAGPQPPGPRDRWVGLEVEELRVATDGAPRLARALARDTLLMRAALGATTRLVVRSPLPTTVLAFERRREFEPYAAALLGPEKEAAGVFLGHRDGNSVVIDASNPEFSRRVLFHELTHFFLRNSMTAGDIPLWLNEGLAEFYSTFDVHGDKVEIGRPIDEHVLMLRERLMPLPALLAATRESAEYNDRAMAPRFYAQSWAVVHYLLIGAENRRGQLAAYVRGLDTGMTPHDAFTAAFAVSEESFEKELAVYLRQRGFFFRSIAVSDLGEPDVPEPGALGGIDATLRLADFLARAPGGRPAARRFIDGVLSARPDHAEALSLLAALLEIEGKLEESRAAHERAVAAGVLDCMSLVLAAESRMAEAAERGDHGAETVEAVGRARELFERSAARCPALWRAHAGVGDCRLFGDQDPAAALAAYQRAAALAPGVAQLRERIRSAREYQEQKERHEREQLAYHQRSVAAPEAQRTVPAASADPPATPAPREAAPRDGGPDVYAAWNAIVAEMEARRYDEALRQLEKIRPFIGKSHPLSLAAEELHRDLLAWKQRRTAVATPTPARP